MGWGRGVTMASLMLVVQTSLAGCLPVSVRPSVGPPASPRASATTTRPGDESVTVQWVIDGDTFSARTSSGRTVTVRLLGIDAPEVDREDVSESDCGAAQSTQALERLVAKQRVVLVRDPTADATDRFARLLRYVATDATPDVAERLVESGMVAAWYPRGEPTPTRFTTYQKLEDAARASRTGLWARCETIGR